MTPKILELWHKTKAILKIDDKPTKGSKNLVTSDGIAEGIAESAKKIVGTASPEFDTLGEIQAQLLYYVRQFTPLVVKITLNDGTFTADKTYLEMEGARNMFRDVVVKYGGSIYTLVAESDNDGLFLFQNCLTPSDDVLVASNFRIDSDNTIRFSQATLSAI